MPLSTGSTLQNRYRIVQLILQGGFGTLYKAWDTNLDKHCALKENLDTSPEAQRQFLKEAKILANLTHTNLPRVTDYFFISGQGQYLIMDYIEGRDLQEILEVQMNVSRTRGRLSELQVFPWINQVCDALSYLHSQNPPIIHRDIKPANIRITLDGKAMLVDFGIAKTYDPKLKTTIGAQAVTPGFSPYEQYGKGKTDIRTDIYALGATLYTLLTGQEPPESVQRVVNDPLISPRQLNPDLSQRVSATMIKALQMDPIQRFQSMGDFKAALNASPVKSKPLSPLPSQFGGANLQVSRSVPPWGWILLVGFLSLILIYIMVLGLNNKVTGNQVTSLTSPIIGTPLSPTLLHNNSEGPTFTSTAAYPVSPTSDLSNNTPPTFSLPITTQVSTIDGMTMVLIPEGEFKMGSSESDANSGEDEKPQHQVYLDAYWIDRIEVTNGMYKLCIRANACKSPEQTRSKTRISYFDNRGYDDYPVIYVSWEDALAYCQWVTRRLPSEAEWEKAARGKNGHIYPWGDTSPNPSLANYNNQIGDTSITGFFTSGVSLYGALDMAGNVAEWVGDWYDEYYYNEKVFSNPFGPAQGEYRVLRGGSWFNKSSAIRTAFRLWNLPAIRSDSIGFRCAQSH